MAADRAAIIAPPLSTSRRTVAAAVAAVVVVVVAVAAVAVAVAVAAIVVVVVAVAAVAVAAVVVVVVAVAAAVAVVVVAAVVAAVAAVVVVVAVAVAAVVVVVAVAAAAAVAVAQLLVDEVVDQALGDLAVGLLVAEDEELLGVAAAALHEAEGARLLLDLAERRAAVPRDVADAVARHGDERHVVALVEVLDVHGARALLEQPLEVGARARALLVRAAHERHLADVLHDAPRGARELAARRAVLAQGVRELRLVHRVRVGGEALLVRDALADPLGEVPRLLRLDGRHALELGAAAAAAVAEDRELLRALVAVPPLLALAQFVDMKNISVPHSSSILPRVARRAPVT